MLSMIRRTAIVTAALGAAVALGSPVLSVEPQAKIGAPAPAFTAVDSNGKEVSLADFKGKTVVLEWTNNECPFVQKHYNSSNMQNLQKKWTDRGVVWLTIISSAPGEQGYVTGAAANKLTADRGEHPTAVLLDPKGTVGHMYGAQVTPHMYVIKADGTLVYMGGIDDKPSTKIEDIKTAKNFVDAALTEVMAGKPVSVTTARPYGCTVKYASS